MTAKSVASPHNKDSVNVMKWIVFVGVLFCEKRLLKRMPESTVLSQRDGKQTSIKQKYLSCCFVAVIIEVRSRDLGKRVLKTGLTHKSANVLS